MAPCCNAILCTTAGMGSPCPRIIHGFGDCLHAGIFSSATAQDARDEPDTEDSQMDLTADADPRATLILHLLLNCLDHEAPSLTHMLLGMDVAGGFEGKANSLSPQAVAAESGHPYTSLPHRAQTALCPCHTAVMLGGAAGTAFSAGNQRLCNQRLQ